MPAFLLFLIVLYFIWVFYCIVEVILDRIEKKHYTQSHFERTERYRRGL